MQGVHKTTLTLVYYIIWYTVHQSTLFNGGDWT